MVRAKFRIDSITSFGYSPAQKEVRAQAVKGGEGEDSEFFASTPAGALSLTISAQPAADWFAARLGKNVYLDFSDV